MKCGCAECAHCLVMRTLWVNIWYLIFNEQFKQEMLLLLSSNWVMSSRVASGYIQRRVLAPRRESQQPKNRQRRRVAGRMGNAKFFSALCPSKNLNCYWRKFAIWGFYWRKVWKFGVFIHQNLIYCGVLLVNQFGIFYWGICPLWEKKNNLSPSGINTLLYPLRLTDPQSSLWGGPWNPRLYGGLCDPAVPLASLG